MECTGTIRVHAIHVTAAAGTQSCNPKGQSRSSSYIIVIVTAFSCRSAVRTAATPPFGQKRHRHRHLQEHGR